MNTNATNTRNTNNPIAVSDQNSRMNGSNGSGAAAVNNGGQQQQQMTNDGVQMEDNGSNNTVAVGSGNSGVSDSPQRSHMPPVAQQQNVSSHGTPPDGIPSQSSVRRTLSHDLNDENSDDATMNDDVGMAENDERDSSQQSTHSGESSQNTSASRSQQNLSPSLTNTHHYHLQVQQKRKSSNSKRHSSSLSATNRHSSQLSDYGPPNSHHHSSSLHNNHHVKTIFISNLPPDTSQREIYLLFRDQEAYTDCMLLQKSGAPPCAFVSFATHSHAVRAMENMQGTQFDPNDSENRIRIELAKNDMRKGFSGASGGSGEQSASAGRSESHKRSRKHTSVLEKDNSKRMRLTNREYHMHSPHERSMDYSSVPSQHQAMHSNLYPNASTSSFLNPSSGGHVPSQPMPSFNQYGMPGAPQSFMMPSPGQYGFPPNVDPSQISHHPYFFHQPQFAFQSQPYGNMPAFPPQMGGTLPHSGSGGGSTMGGQPNSSEMQGSPSHSSPRPKRRRRHEQSPSPMQQHENSPSPEDFERISLHRSQRRNQPHFTLRIPLLRDPSQEAQLHNTSSCLKGFLDIEKAKDFYLVLFETEHQASKALDILRALNLSGDTPVDVEYFSGSD